MKAMILAAGLGQRMRPLTDNLPKPLLPLAGKPLLVYHLEALSAAGIREVVINLAYLGDKIRDAIGDGSHFGLQVTYSPEPEPLETGGGLLRALPLLGNEPFLLLNGDVWSDWQPSAWAGRPLGENRLGHLLLVPNPVFHPDGDFALEADGILRTEGSSRYTFAGISLLHPRLIADYPHKRERFPLVEAFRAVIAAGRLTGEVHEGCWSDVGTPQRLAELEQRLRSPC